MTKNRMIVEKDRKNLVTCSVHSSTHEKKTRLNIVQKKGYFYAQQNALTEDMPVCVLFKVGSCANVDLGDFFCLFATFENFSSFKGDVQFRISFKTHTVFVFAIFQPATSIAMVKCYQVQKIEKQYGNERSRSRQKS